MPAELLEAARIDGAGEWRTFFTISLRLLRPGLVTVLLFTRGRDLEQLLPAADHAEPAALVPADGRPQQLERAVAAPPAGRPIYNLVITGSLLTVIPIMIAFLFMQRYWQSGLAAGSVKQ